MTTCRVLDGGKPLCRLASLGCRTVEVKGAAYTSVLSGKRDGYDYTRDYEIIIVAEAPGAEEDKIGIPFQGRAGDKLHSFIEASGIAHDKIFVTNMVPCRPPQNRKPSSDEFKSCSTYIDEDIRRIQPKIILLLGGSAIRLFNLNRYGGITKIRGTVYRKSLPTWEDGPEFTIIPSLHPAAFLHREDLDLEKRVKGDFIKAARLLKGEESDPFYKPQFTVADSVQDVEEMLHAIYTTQGFMYDTESASFEFWKMPHICSSYSWGYPNKTTIIPFYQHDPEGLDWKLKDYWRSRGTTRSAIYQKLAEVHEDPNIWVGAFNYPYDSNVYRVHGKIVNKGQIRDPQSMRHLMNENPPRDLETLLDMEFNTGDYSFNVRDIVGHGRKKIKSYDCIPDQIMWPYTATDAEGTWRLGDKWWAELQKSPGLFNLYQSEYEPAFELVASAAHDGVYIYSDKVEALKEEYEQTREDLIIKLRNQVGPEFKPGAPAQVAKALVDLGYRDKIEDTSKSQGFNTSKEKLLDMAGELDFASDILEFRRLNKFISTYLEPLLEDRDENGRVHYSMNQTGTVTGRWAAKRLHQVHKIDENRVKAGKVVMRDIFGAPPEKLYFYADASQIELRVGYVVTADPELRKVIENNEDLHSITTALVLDIPISEVTKFNRSEIGKRVNFGLFYGSEGFSIVKTGQWEDSEGKMRPVTWDMMQRGMSRFFKRFKGVSAYINDTPDIARIQGGKLINAFGRVRRLGVKLNDPEEGVRKHAERELINFLIQSAAGSVCVRTIIAVNQYIQKLVRTGELAPYDVKFLMQVHDSVAYEIHPRLEDWFTVIFKNISQRPIPELDNLIVPWNCGVGQTWTEAELAAG